MALGAALAQALAALAAPRHACEVTLLLVGVRGSVVDGLLQRSFDGLWRWCWSLKPAGKKDASPAKYMFHVVLLLLIEQPHLLVFCPFLEPDRWGINSHTA